MIRELGTATFEGRWRGCELGVVHALVPLPLAHDPRLDGLGVTDFADRDARWDGDFRALVGRLVDAASARSTTPLAVIAPPLRSSRRPWIGRLIRFATFQPTIDPRDRNPLGLGPDRALLAAAAGEQVRFAVLGGGNLEILVCDTLRVLWVWLAEPALGQDEWLARVAGGLPLEALAPSGAVRVPFHEDCVIQDVHAREVLWSDGAGVLAFRAEFLLPHPNNQGVPDPRRVFVPPADEWSASAPRWAWASRSRLVADLVEHRWNVVDSPSALVCERQRPRADV